ncbi:hypothetical protein ACJRO7_000020 [Eucalyptus globulus]|uniref:Uncharacterized protein n=1 Tax=Eucalyptus globulus TaxID=34317 RepID=A0ABD3LLB7_EUCGL
MRGQGSKARSQQKTPIDPALLREAVYDYQKALDDLVSVNSLFTVAVFVGLVFESGEQQNIAGDKKCEAGVPVARRLVRNEVISFAFYLFYSLVAKSLKTHLFTYLIGQPDIEKINNLPSQVLRGSLFALSTSTSIMGCVSCKGIEMLNAVGALIGVNTFALLIYIPFVGHAIVKSTNIKVEGSSSKK